MHRGSGSVGIRVVAPAREDPLAEGNAGSVALSLGRPPWTLLVLGDLDGAALSRTIESGAIGPTSALILAHHGSRRGTTEALLGQVVPDLALVSCGWRNRFGHPHPEALKPLSTLGVPLWRTDHHGNIRLRATGRGWSVTVNPRTSPGTR